MTHIDQITVTLIAEGLTLEVATIVAGVLVREDVTLERKRALIDTILARHSGLRGW